MLRKFLGDFGDMLAGTSGNKLDRFTQRARLVLVEAQNEAERRGDGWIRTEYLLLGLWRQKHSVAGKVLRKLVPDTETFENLLQEIATSVEPTGKTMDLTKEVKRTLDYSVDEARYMGHRWIGTEHLLIAITRQNETVAYRVLMQLGLNSDRVQETTRQVLQEIPKTADGKPLAEINRIPDEVLENFHIRLVMNEPGSAAKQVIIPVKQFSDQLNTALEAERTGKFLAIEIENGSVELFLDEAPPSE